MHAIRVMLPVLLIVQQPSNLILELGRALFALLFANNREYILSSSCFLRSAMTNCKAASSLEGRKGQAGRARLRSLCPNRYLCYLWPSPTTTTFNFRGGFTLFLPTEGIQFADVVHLSSVSVRYPFNASSQRPISLKDSRD